MSGDGRMLVSKSKDQDAKCIVALINSGGGVLKMSVVEEKENVTKDLNAVCNDVVVHHGGGKSSADAFDVRMEVEEHEKGLHVVRIIPPTAPTVALTAEWRTTSEPGHHSGGESSHHHAASPESARRWVNGLCCASFEEVRQELDDRNPLTSKIATSIRRQEIVGAAVGAGCCEGGGEGCTDDGKRVEVVDFKFANAHLVWSTSGPLLLRGGGKKKWRESLFDVLWEASETHPGEIWCGVTDDGYPIGSTMPHTVSCRAKRKLEHVADAVGAALGCVVPQSPGTTALLIPVEGIDPDGWGSEVYVYNTLVDGKDAVRLIAACKGMAVAAAVKASGEKDWPPQVLDDDIMVLTRKPPAVGVDDWMRVVDEDDNPCSELNMAAKLVDDERRSGWTLLPRFVTLISMRPPSRLQQSFFPEHNSRAVPNPWCFHFTLEPFEAWKPWMVSRHHDHNRPISSVCLDESLVPRLVVPKDFSRLDPLAMWLRCRSASSTVKSLASSGYQVLSIRSSMSVHDVGDAVNYHKFEKDARIMTTEKSGGGGGEEKEGEGEEEEEEDEEEEERVESDVMEDERLTRYIASMHPGRRCCVVCQLAAVPTLALSLKHQKCDVLSPPTKKKTLCVVLVLETIETIPSEIWDTRHRVDAALRMLQGVSSFFDVKLVDVVLGTKSVDSEDREHSGSMLSDGDGTFGKEVERVEVADQEAMLEQGREWAASGGLHPPSFSLVEGNIVVESSIGRMIRIAINNRLEKKFGVVSVTRRLPGLGVSAAMRWSAYQECRTKRVLWVSRVPSTGEFDEFWKFVTNNKPRERQEVVLFLDRALCDEPASMDILGSKVKDEDVVALLQFLREKSKICRNLKLAIVCAWSTTFSKDMTEHIAYKKCESIQWVVQYHEEVNVEKWLLLEEALSGVSDKGRVRTLREDLARLRDAFLRVGKGRDFDLADGEATMDGKHGESGGGGEFETRVDRRRTTSRVSHAATRVEEVGDDVFGEEKVGRWARVSPPIFDKNLERGMNEAIDTIVGKISNTLPLGRETEGCYHTDLFYTFLLSASRGKYSTLDDFAKHIIADLRSDEKNCWDKVVLALCVLGNFGCHTGGLPESYARGLLPLSSTERAANAWMILVDRWSVNKLSVIGIRFPWLGRCILLQRACEIHKRFPTDGIVEETEKGICRLVVKTLLVETLEFLASKKLYGAEDSSIGLQLGVDLFVMRHTACLFPHPNDYPRVVPFAPSLKIHADVGSLRSSPSSTSGGGEERTMSRREEADVKSRLEEVHEIMVAAARAKLMQMPYCWLIEARMRRWIAQRCKEEWIAKDAVKLALDAWRTVTTQVEYGDPHVKRSFVFDEVLAHCRLVCANITEDDEMRQKGEKRLRSLLDIATHSDPKAAARLKHILKSEVEGDRDDLESDEDTLHRGHGFSFCGLQYD